LTGLPEFRDDNAVIEYAVEVLFNQLRKSKVL